MERCTGLPHRRKYGSQALRTSVMVVDDCISSVVSVVNILVLALAKVSTATAMPSDKQPSLLHS